jgi:predicted CXXCH cytochrome family protein
VPKMPKVKNYASLFCLLFFAGFLLSMIVPDGADAKGTEATFKKCLKCHPGIQKEMAAKKVHTPFGKFQCSSCHTPHASKYKYLMKDEISGLCRSCHKGEKAAFEKKHSHIPFEEGACLKCHNPHSSENPKLLVARGEQLCFACHSPKEMFSKKNKHDPARKGNCLRCHRPHTSDYEALLQNDPKKICVTCHSVNDEKSRKAHLDYPVQDSLCTSCHNPHGSDRRHLVKDFPHKPFAQKKCGTCHKGLGSKNPQGLKDKEASVCLACHQATGKDFNKINSHVDRGVFCVNCHTPHASDHKHLTKAREGKICFNCHEDVNRQMRDKENQYKHPVLKEGKCSSCHRPHGSNFRLFFGADEFLVCTECHKRHAKFTHPIGKDAIDPRSKRDITCITCHNLMGSPYEFSLRFDRKKQLCIQCHKGY